MHRGSVVAMMAVLGYAAAQSGSGTPNTQEIEPTITTVDGKIVLNGNDILFNTLSGESSVDQILNEFETRSEEVDVTIQSAITEANSNTAEVASTLNEAISSATSAASESITQLGGSVTDLANFKSQLGGSSCNTAAGESMVGVGANGAATCNNDAHGRLQSTLNAQTSTLSAFMASQTADLNYRNMAFEDHTINGTARGAMRCPNGAVPTRLVESQFRFRGRRDVRHNQVVLTNTNSFIVYNTNHDNGAGIFDNTRRAWSIGNYRGPTNRLNGMEIRLNRPGYLINAIAYCIRRYSSDSMTNNDGFGSNCYSRNDQYGFNRVQIDYFNEGTNEWVRAATRNYMQRGGNWISGTVMKPGHSFARSWRMVFPSPTHPGNSAAHVAEVDFWACF